MKKIIVCAMAACLSFTFLPQQSVAATTTNSSLVANSNATDAAAAGALVSRLHDIKAMDVSSMNAIEKKVLRKEVRSIKQQLNHIGGGVYISAGAVILIIILLIILL